MVSVPPAAWAELPTRPDVSGSVAGAPGSLRVELRENADNTMIITPCAKTAPVIGRRRLNQLYSAACGALSDQRAISVFEAKDSSTSFFGVSTPATGRFVR